MEATDKREVVLPFNKVLEQFTAFQVRSDQMVSDSVPQLETPFLKMTIEDGQRFGTPATPVSSPAPLISSSSNRRPTLREQAVATAPEAAAVSSRPIDPDPPASARRSRNRRRRWPGSGVHRTPTVACASAAGRKNFTERNGRARR